MAAPDKSVRSPSKAQAWFCTTGLASDVVIEVGDVSFHLHKFPLMYRSNKLHQLIGNSQRRKTEEEEKEEEIEEEGEKVVGEQQHISIPNFPGGPEAFEAAAKFCYGVKIELTASNVVPLRCAAEFLEMTEEISEGNLVTKTERFLSQSALRTLKDSVKALRSCDGKLLEMAEDLGITQRCVDSIASKAAATASTSVAFGIGSNRILWNGIDTRSRRRKSGCNSRSSTATATATAAAEVLSDPWFEELVSLSLPVFSRVISAMKSLDLSSEVIEWSLICYSQKFIPGLSRSSRKSHSVPPPSDEQVQIELLEMVVKNLPVQKSATSTNTKVLFGLLRTANILRASEAVTEALERKIGLQLEQATLDDLLIPSYSHLVETLYDVACVERLIGRFLEGSGGRNCDGGDLEEDGEGGDGRSPLLLVGKLIDGYLSEIASDGNLGIEKFCCLALLLPDQARVYDDGLYRAVDVYLKAHPGLTEAERERMCGVMDCQKLTLEACTHAAQNERLPLRAVVQVLFFEQLQLRQAIAGSLFAAEQQPESGRLSRCHDDAAAAPRGGGGGMWPSAMQMHDNQALRVDMDSMRNRVHELEEECSNMKKVIEKIDRSAFGARSPGWGSVSKKFGCKFRTQVCDSHQQNIVEAMDVRNRRTEQST